MNDKKELDCYTYSELPIACKGFTGHIRIKYLGSITATFYKGNTVKAFEDSYDDEMDYEDPVYTEWEIDDIVLDQEEPEDSYMDCALNKFEGIYNDIYNEYKDTIEDRMKWQTDFTLYDD